MISVCFSKLDNVPNYLNPATVTVNMGVCDLHWPSEIPTVKSNRWNVPAVLPSLFSFPSSFCRQIVSKGERSIEGRRISIESRSTPKQKATKIDMDLIPNWEAFLTHSKELDMPYK